MSGTPADAMIGLSAVSIDPPTKACGKVDKALVSVYKPPEVDPSVRAFSWGSLTSGNPASALWILLLPYMLANVAGWAILPPARPRVSSKEDAVRSWSVRLITMLVRIAGLVVTVIFVLCILLTFLDVIGYQGIAQDENLGWARYGPAAGIAVTAVLVGILSVSTRLRLRDDKKRSDPWADNQDPVGYGSLVRSQSTMWNSPGIIVRLRMLHLSASLGFIASISMLSLGKTSVPAEDIDGVLTSVAAAATFLPVLLVGIVSLSKGRDLTLPTFLIRWVAWPLSLVAVAATLCRFVHADLTGETAQHLPIIRGAGAWIAGLLLVTVCLGALVGAATRDDTRSARWAGFNQPALLLTGATVAVIFGAGIATQAARFFGDKRCPSVGAEDCKPVVGDVIDWISTGFTLMLAVLVVVLAVRAVGAWRRSKGELRMFRMLRCLTDNVSKILLTLTVIGTVAVVVGLFVGALTEFGPVVVPLWLTAPAVVVLLSPVVGAVAFLLWSNLRWWSVVPGAGLVALVTWIVRSGRTFEVADIPLPPGTFRTFAHVVTLTLPMALAVTRLVAGFRDRDARRGVAVIWDLGNFWPRWFHPFAPPTYSDSAVTKLRETIETGLEKDKAVLLAPHSQGSIIAAASVVDLEVPTDRLALLTYGSPLSRLYAQVFPAIFTTELLEKMCEKLGTREPGGLRWHNLFRPTDPIGGEVAAQPPGILKAMEGVDVPVTVQCDRNHSDYALDDEYRDNAKKLRAAITSPS